MATLASVAPSESEPVSPINTLAGLVLNTKKPSNEPTNTKQKIAISSYPCAQVDPHAIMPKARKAIADNPPASQSSPSVKLTALELATKMKSKNNP